MAITFTAGTSVESTASVTSTTVTLPSGLAAGDYTIIAVSLNASAGTISTPAGWTNILASTSSVNGSTSDVLAVFYRKWVSGDTNPAITTTSGRVAATPIKVSGADGTTFVADAAAVLQNASGATPITASSFSPTAPTVVGVFNGRHASNGVFLTPFSAVSAGLTKLAEANGKSTTQTNAGHCIATGTFTTGTATGTLSATPANAPTGSMGVTFTLNAASTGGSTQTVTPTGIASAEAVGTPSLSSVATLTPDGLTSSEAVGTPSVSTTVTVSPTGIPSALGLGSPTLSSVVTVTPDGITSTEALGSPTLSGSTSVTPDGIASGEALGSPMASSSTSVTPDGIASAVAVGNPSLSEVPTATTVTPVGIPSASMVGSPTLHSSTSVQPDGIASAAAVGSPSITPWTVMRPTGIPSTRFVGQPLLQTSVRIFPVGIPSGVVIGLPVLSGPGASPLHLDLEGAIPKPNFKASITPRDQGAILAKKRWKGHIG